MTENDVYACRSAMSNVECDVYARGASATRCVGVVLCESFFREKAKQETLLRASAPLRAFCGSVSGELYSGRQWSRATERASPRSTQRCTASVGSTTDMAYSEEGRPLTYYVSPEGTPTECHLHHLDAGP